MTTLDEYLDREAGRRWSWGSCDCVCFGLGWAREHTGRHLTAFFAYGSRRDAVAALQARGGLERIVSEWMAANGFHETSEPDDGDIGLAPVPAAHAERVSPVAIVIRRGPWWITREPKGIGGMQFDGIPAWRVA